MFATRVGFAFFCLAAAGIQNQFGTQSSIRIPKEGEGYQIDRADHPQSVPPGYEGKIDIATETAVGNTPATAGKRVEASLTLSNLIKTCPLADGTAEGTGTFSVSATATDTKPDGITTTHAEMITKAKYKGTVGDNALLSGPVIADIDYTFNQTESTQNKKGEITSSTPLTFTQHFTLPVNVMPGFEPPTFKPFSGGDPAGGHYSQATGAGMALAYWGGVYYSVAELKWYGGDTSKPGAAVKPGVCAQIAFDPPSNTLQPPLGARANVNAMVKAKTGEIVPGNFVDSRAYDGGDVSPAGGKSQTSSPLHLVYTAPNQKTGKSAGFAITVLSRAGTADAQWNTGLGSGWSGEITYTKTYTGDHGHSDLQDWSISGADSVTIVVKDGVGSYSGHSEHKVEAENRQAVALGGGKVTYRTETTESSVGGGDGVYPIALSVNIDELHGTYSVDVSQKTDASGKPMSVPASIGKENWTRCYRTDCHSGQSDVGMPSIGLMGPLGGNLKDANHIQASYTEKKEQLGRAKNAVMTQTTTVNLARSGHTNRTMTSK